VSVKVSSLNQSSTIGNKFGTNLFSRKRITGVNFINVLRAAFALADPKSTKKTDNLTDFFALLGSACVKAARRMLLKLTPDVVGKLNLAKLVEGLRIEHSCIDDSKGVKTDSKVINLLL